MTLGEMTMPANFRYREVFSLGRPRHRQGDSFAQKHPAMDRGKRAKIFSPFDALRGFSDAVAAKDVQYENRPELTEEEKLEMLLFLSGGAAETFMNRAIDTLIQRYGTVENYLEREMGVGAAERQVLKARFLEKVICEGN